MSRFKHLILMDTRVKTVRETNTRIFRYLPLLLYVAYQRNVPFTGPEIISFYLPSRDNLTKSLHFVP